MPILSGLPHIAIESIATLALIGTGSDYLFRTSNFEWKFSRPLVARLFGALYLVVGLYLGYEIFVYYGMHR